MSKRPTPIPNHRRVKPIAARDPAAGHKHTARRQLIAAAGLSGATAALPHWTKPAIQTLFLPAHAQSSPTPTPSPSPSSGSPTPAPTPQSRQTFYLSRDESDTYSLLLDLDGSTNASTDSDSANMVAQFNFTQISDIDTIRVTKLGGGRNWRLQSSTFTEGQHYAAVDLEHEKFNIELAPVDQNGGNTAGSNAAAFESYQIDLQLRLANSRTGPPDLLIIEIENRSGVSLTFQVAGVPINTTYALRINYPSAANPTRLNGNTTRASNTISVQATIPFGTSLGTGIDTNDNAAASVVLTPQTDNRFSGTDTAAYTCATSADCTDDENVALFSTDEIFTIPDNGPQSVTARIGKMEVNATETITLTLSGLSSFIPPLYTLTLLPGTLQADITVTSSMSISEPLTTGTATSSANSEGTVFTIRIPYNSTVVFRSVPCDVTLTLGGHANLRADNTAFPLDQGSDCMGKMYTAQINDTRSGIRSLPFSGGTATSKATTKLIVEQGYDHSVDHWEELNMATARAIGTGGTITINERTSFLFQFAFQDRNRMPLPVESTYDVDKAGIGMIIEDFLSNNTPFVKVPYTVTGRATNSDGNAELTIEWEANGDVRDSLRITDGIYDFL